MANKTPIRSAFQMPTPMTISGRASTITAAFVCAIVPRIEPSGAEIKAALKILEMDPNDVRCAYCGDKATEWDHLHPLVKDREATGFVSEIGNLVPSCGKCNQSKGNKEWRTWITSDAKQSPKARDVSNLQRKIALLERYDAWGHATPIDLRAIVSDEDWQRHWANRDALLKAMDGAQSHASKLRGVIEEAQARRRRN